MASPVTDDEEITYELFDIANEGDHIADHKISLLDKNKEVSYGINSNTKAKLCVGSHVEARYGGNSRYYPGEITRCCSDGGYDILYKNGEQELGVANDLLRLEISDIRQQDSDIRVEDIDSKVDSDINSTYPQQGVIHNQLEGSAKYTTGSIIEAKYRGSSKFYPGRITGCHTNGTCNTLFNAGRCMIRLITGIQEHGFTNIKPKRTGKCKKKNDELEQNREEVSSDNYEDSSLSVGMLVEARYRGNSNFRRDTITKCHLDATYDITYDDGECELSITKLPIRSPQHHEQKSDQSVIASRGGQNTSSRKDSSRNLFCQGQHFGEECININKRHDDDKPHLLCVNTNKDTLSRGKDRAYGDRAYGDRAYGETGHTGTGHTGAGHNFAGEGNNFAGVDGTGTGHMGTGHNFAGEGNNFAGVDGTFGSLPCFVYLYPSSTCVNREPMLVVHLNNGWRIE